MYRRVALGTAFAGDPEVRDRTAFATRSTPFSTTAVALLIVVRALSYRDNCAGVVDVVVVTAPVDPPAVGVVVVVVVTDGATLASAGVPSPWSLPPASDDRRTSDGTGVVTPFPAPSRLGVEPASESRLGANAGDALVDDDVDDDGAAAPVADDGTCTLGTAGAPAA